MEIKSINISVGEQLSRLGSTKVVDTVVETLVTKEIQRRAEALSAILKLHEQGLKDLSKFKADNITYNEDGSVAGSTWSKAKLDEKKKVSEKLTKIEKAVVKATESNDWSDVYNFSKGDVKEEKKDDTAANT